MGRFVLFFIFLVIVSSQIYGINWYFKNAWSISNKVNSDASNQKKGNMTNATSKGLNSEFSLNTFWNILQNMSYLNHIQKRRFKIEKINSSDSNKLKIEIYDRMVKIKKYMNIISISYKPHKFRLAALNVEKYKIRIYVYGNYDMISNKLLTWKSWEGHWLASIVTLIRLNPTLQFMDIGCNLGVYTLTAAAAGISVVSVDANPLNVARLEQSLVLNKLESKVKLLQNAVSDVRGPFGLRKVPDNIGGQSIVPNQSGVWGVSLDEISLLLNPARPVFIKMDIEGSESKALTRAGKLFKELNIGAVLMEWSGMVGQSNETIRQMLDFFHIHGYKVFKDFSTDLSLNHENVKKWPSEVLWKKNGIINFK